MVAGLGVKILSALAVAALASNAQVDPLAALPEAQRPATPLILQQPPVALPQPSTALTGFAAYKVRLSALARSAGIREATIQSIIPYLQLNGRVMELDRSQRPISTSTSGSSAPASFGRYINRHITASLINRGYSRYAGHWTNLSRIRDR